MDVTAMLFEMIERPLAETGAEMFVSIRENLSTPAPPHSSVGEAPHMVTMTLRNSLDYEVTTLSETSMQLMIGAGPTDNAPDNPGFDYAPYLETEMGRPYLLSRAEEAADLFIQKFLAQ